MVEKMWETMQSGFVLMADSELLVSLEYLSNRSTKMESEKKSFRTVFNPHCVEPFL